MNTQHIFEKYLDAAKWGVSDLYEDAEKTLRDAINNLFGNGTGFDTGWYGVKKEIQSARIVINADKTGQVSVSCSDDFDTEGLGTVPVDLKDNLTVEHCYHTIINCLDDAADLAEANRKENECYAGFSIGPDNKGKISSWIYTLILPVGIAEDWDSPPGDNYSKWGWQEDTPELPDKCKAVIEQFAYGWIYNTNNTRNRLIKNGIVCGGWRIQPWEHD